MKLSHLPEPAKWAVSVLAVLTAPVWIIPLFVGGALWDATKSFKEIFLDKGDL